MKKLEIVCKDMLDNEYRNGFLRGAIYGVLITILALRALASLRFEEHSLSALN
jgi:hypothetical protein